MGEIITPTGKFLTPYQDIPAPIQAGIMIAGDLITPGKIVIPGVVLQKGGGVVLKSFTFTQTKTATTIQAIGLEFRIYDNEDALGVLVSGDPFAYDATTTRANVKFYHKFADGDWVTEQEGNNASLNLNNINKYCSVELATQMSLAYSLTTTGTPTYGTHTFLTDFVFEQCISR